jgi:LysR family transcriptional regulator, transcriptional activator of the cysJI operon
MKTPAPRRAHVSLDRLESFVAAAECGGITAAAKRLGRSQPTVSQHLQRLEVQLDRQLVARSPGGLRLTAEGRRLLPLARDLLSLDGQLAAPTDQAPLRLGACSNIGVYLLPELLIDLRRQGQPLPQVAIAGNPEIAHRLAAGEIDVALMEWWEDQAGFVSRIWRREPVVAIVPPDHPLARRKTVALAALRREKLLGGEPGTGTGRLLRTYLRAGKPLDVVMNLGSSEAVKRAVAAGLGVSLVLQLSVAEHWAGRARGLAVRPLTPALFKPLHLIWRTGLPADRGLLACLLGAAAVQ